MPLMQVWLLFSSYRFLRRVFISFLGVCISCGFIVSVALGQAPAKTKATNAKLQVTNGKAFHARAPKSMQEVFHAPKRPSAKPQVFNYQYFCGRNAASQHKVYICILEDGRIFGGVPPNIDQNDRIYVYLIVRTWMSHLYKVQIARRSQFQLLPSTTVVPLSALKPTKKPTFIVRKYVFGPFRAGVVSMAVRRPAIGRPGQGRVYARKLIQINPLVQFNVAVAFIGITPVKTSFGLFRERGSSLTRIARKNQGVFAIDFILMAKIYSWQIWDPNLFAGRDVLKPPTFLQRFNINIGFSFQDPFRSFFLGVGFEINRGLDIVVGVNLRPESVLTGGFEENNLFSGDESEIPVREEIRPAFYVGLSITPEIFRSVFKLLSGGSLFGGG